MPRKSKKRKSIKKYVVGGDLRMSPADPYQSDILKGGYSSFGDDKMLPEPPSRGDDGSATGQVKQISTSARKAADFLKGAGRAQQEAGTMLGNVDQGGKPLIPTFPPVFEPPIPQMKKGGKVKKLKAAPRPKMKPKRPRVDPAAAGIKNIRGGQTPREALAGKTHVSPSREASGRGPGGTEHPGMGLRGATIRKEIEEATPAPVIRAPRGPTKRRPTPQEITAGFEGLDLPKEDRVLKKKKKKSVKKNVGGMIKYGHGGKVRGAGKAIRGVRPAKMVKMKGS